MARTSERAFVASVLNPCKWVLTMGTCIALLVSHPVLAQTPGQIHQQAINIQYKLNYLERIASLTQDPVLQKWARQQIDNELQELRSTEWDAYRLCEAMKHPNQYNDGEIYKLLAMEEHRKQAALSLSGISSIYGGVSSPAKTTLSATTGEANGTAQGQAIDIAKDLTEGSEISELLGKLSSALSIFDAASQLYHAWKAMSLGSDIIAKRRAADAALTDCKKPKEPEHRQQLAQGTPQLGPFPPGPPPAPPKNPPPPENPKHPPPQNPTSLRQFLQAALNHSRAGK